MKKRTIIPMAMIFLLMLLTACGAQEVAQPSAQPSEQPDWGFEENTKTLYVNVDIGTFEPNAPDFEGTTNNAPWAEYLPQIENIVVGDGVTFIGDYTFAFCPKLKNVEVGKNVTALDFRCFFKCGDWDNDSNLEFHFNSMPTFGEDVFGYTWDNPNVTVFVPDDMKGFWANYIMQKGEMQLDGYVYEKVAMPESSEDVINAMLINPQQLYLGDIGKISQNEGGHIGNIVYENRCGDERMEIFAGNEGTAEIPFETRLRDFGSDNRAQQAVLVKFQPERADNLRFDFIGMGDYSITFEEGEWWFVDVKNFSKTSFSDYMPNAAVLDGFTIYNILFATDADMNLRVMIWADGNYQNQAYFETSLYQGMDDIYKSNWKMNIFFGLGDQDGIGQLNIYEYAVYTFDNFTETMPTVSGN